MRALLFAAATFAAMAHGAAAQECQEIRFARGAYSGEVSGVLRPDDMPCFLIGTGAGQTARVEVFGDPNVAFTILDVVDNMGDVTFRTEARHYQINVYQTLRTLQNEPFTLRVTIR